MQSTICLKKGGLGDFCRWYDYNNDNPQEVQLRIKSQYLDEVLASLTVLGNVTHECAEFVPENPPQNETNLKIDPNKVLTSAFNKLRGSKVSVKQVYSPEVVKGVCFGIQEQTEMADNNVVVRNYFVIKREDGSLLSVADQNLSSLYFDDSKIQAEIDKVLAKNYEELNPNSKVVVVKVRPNDRKGRFGIMLTQPAGTWKMSYRLIEDQDGKLAIEAHAVVDNDTDEDWKETIVSVATGKPVSFRTNLASVYVPERDLVDVSDSAVIGNVELAEVCYGDEGLERASSFGGGMGESPIAQAAMFSGPSKYAKVPRANVRAAATKTVGTTEIYTSPSPINIGSNRSALVPLFNRQLGEGKTVLLYKEEAHPSCFLRTIKFKNTTGKNLVRGVCVVFKEGVNMGKKFLEQTQDGEECFVPHALEESVRMQHSSQQESKWVRVKIGNGVAVFVKKATAKTKYKINNRLDKDYDCEIEHKSFGDNFKLASVNDYVTFRQVDGGYRFSVKAPGKGVVEFEVVEVHEEESQYSLKHNASSTLQFLQSNLVHTENPLGSHKGVVKAFEMKKQVEDAEFLLNKLHKEVDTLTKGQERLVGTIDRMLSEEKHRFSKQLSENEDRLQELEKEIIPTQEELVKKKSLELDEYLFHLELPEWHA